MQVSKTSKPNGYIIWQGDSLLDGAPIMVVAIGFNAASSNRKTGDMIQTYIIRRDIAPTDAVQTGADFSICGNCVHRGKVEPVSPRSKRTRNKGRTCYVNLGQGALAVYRAYTRNAYPLWDGYGVNLRKVRLGTYGDPAAVPVWVWENLLRDADGHTGYTHQWRDPRLAPLRKYCMASVDTPEEAAIARAKGWRTFRVGLPSHPTAERGVEALCPASAEAGKKLSCATCLACDGVASARRGSIFIPAHGGTAVMANIRKRDTVFMGVRVAVETAA